VYKKSKILIPVSSHSGKMFAKIVGLTPELKLIGFRSFRFLCTVGNYNFVLSKHLRNKNTKLPLFKSGVVRTTKNLY